DLAIGVTIGPDRATTGGMQTLPLGEMDFVFAVAPHHPLAAAAQALCDSELVQHRAVAVADSAQRLEPTTVNLLPGQDVLTVASMQHKIEALLRCMGCGYVPEPMVREHLADGRLVAKTMERASRLPKMGYAWRNPDPSA